LFHKRVTVTFTDTFTVTFTVTRFEIEGEKMTVLLNLKNTNKILLLSQIYVHILDSGYYIFLKWQQCHSTVIHSPIHEMALSYLAFRRIIELLQ